VRGIRDASWSDPRSTRKKSVYQIIKAETWWTLERFVLQSTLIPAILAPIERLEKFQLQLEPM